MATKKQIAEQAMRIVSGGHLKPDRTIDIREVMLVVDQLRDKYIEESVKINYEKFGEYSIDGDYISHIALTAVLDSTSGFFRAPISVGLLSLPRGIEVHQIWEDGDQYTDPLIICPAGQIVLSADAIARSPLTFCWREDAYIYFSGSATNFNMQAVVSSKDIAEGATLPLAPGAEAEILQQLVQIFGVMQQVPHDEVEDGQK